ncbi:response regulator [bacterium]|nr:response regulator [bacterium]
MNDQKIKILLIEDDPEDTHFIKALLIEEQEASFELECADCLQEGLTRLAAKDRFDLILLDLALPDSQGLATFDRVHAQTPQIPIVVLSGLDDEEVAIKAMQKGAQDYLVKGQVESRLLVRFIRYAIERHLLMRQYEQGRLRAEHERELRSFKRLSGPLHTTITAQSFGLASLRESAPETFKEMVQYYGDLLDLCLEQRAFKVDHNISEGLRVIAERITFLKAGPRDVVDIHTTALNKKNNKATLPKIQAHLEEGRLLALGLMGCLVSHYRTYSLGSAGSEKLQPLNELKTQKR